MFLETCPVVGDTCPVTGRSCPVVPSTSHLTTGHPKFLTLLYAPWDSASKNALQQFSAAALSSRRVLEDRGQELIVFVTVSARFCVRFDQSCCCCIHPLWLFSHTVAVRVRSTARRALVYVKSLVPTDFLLPVWAFST